MKSSVYLTIISVALISFVVFSLRQPVVVEPEKAENLPSNFEIEWSVANSIPTVDEDENALVASTAFEIEKPKGRVLIVRGIMTVFSLGLNELGSKLQQLGYDVQVVPAVKSKFVVDDIADKINAANDGIPLIIVGHSLGGDIAPDLSRSFGKKNVSVDLVVMLDSTHPTAPPTNVKRCVNFYQKDRTKLFKGGRVRAHQSTTEIFNVNIRELAPNSTVKNIDHFNIDENPWIHQLIINAVVKNGAISSHTDLTDGIDFNRIAESDSHTNIQKPSDWLKRKLRR